MAQIESKGHGLSREELRTLLAATRPPAPGGTSPAAQDLVPAAVLVGLVGRAEGPAIILTQRTAELTNHPAEISLPGGRVEADDDGPQGAALREALEEIGLPPSRVDVLGWLPPSVTISRFLVHPLVGWIEPPVDLHPDPREVADVFEVPLSFVMDPAGRHRESLIRDGVRHNFYVMLYGGRRIWGATAEILHELARALDCP